MPQQRADPFALATPRISKSDGQRADPSSLSDPISKRKVPQHDVASYALPNRPKRQLTKHDLDSYDFKLPNAIESVANSALYLRNTVYRNDLILDNELRTSNALTCFFLDGEVSDLQPGFNLLIDERAGKNRTTRTDREEPNPVAWERVPNSVFFNAIRMAWNNFFQRDTYNQEGSSSTSTVQLNADVIWLEDWFPTAFLHPETRLQMTFLHAEVLDILARARQLQKLFNWEDEGAVVDRLIETAQCLKRHRDWHWADTLSDTGNGSLSGRVPSGRISLSLLTSGSHPGRSVHHRSGPGGREDLVEYHWRVPATAHSSKASLGLCCPYSQRGPPPCPVRREDRLPVPVRLEDRLPANQNPYAPRAARAVADIIGCEGCGRQGHTAAKCFSTRHPNWNTQHATVQWRDTAVAQEIRILANGDLRSLPPDGVQWLPEDKVWIGGEKLKAWKAKI